MRTKQTPAPIAAADRLCLGALARIFPADVVDAAIARAGCQQERKRLLPARLMVYDVIAMTLFSHCGYREVMRRLSEGLKAAGAWPANWHVPAKSAIALGRQRIGEAPLRALFDRVVRPLATPKVRGAWFRGRWRVVALDGTTVDIPDSEDNAATFGRPGSSRGEKSGYPQVRIASVVECGTHAYLDFVYGPLIQGEVTLARPLLRCLHTGMLCLAERNFFGFQLWQQAARTGADLLWRVKKNVVLDPIQLLPDGSYLSFIYPSGIARRRHKDGVLVRVIEYVLDDPGRAPLITYRLITTILDPAAAPAAELAVLYCERQEFELAEDEMKTHQRGAGVVLRSRTSAGVAQEICAYFLAHYAVRALMTEAALQRDIDPERLSFTHTIHIIRRKTIAQRVFLRVGCVSSSSRCSPRSSRRSCRLVVYAPTPGWSSARCPSSMSSTRPTVVGLSLLVPPRRPSGSSALSERYWV